MLSNIARLLDIRDARDVRIVVLGALVVGLFFGIAGPRWLGLLLAAYWVAVGARAARAWRGQIVTRRDLAHFVLFALFFGYLVVILIAAQIGMYEGIR